jgi:hypothetical protein
LHEAALVSSSQLAAFGSHGDSVHVLAGRPAPDHHLSEVHHRHVPSVACSAYPGSQVAALVGEAHVAALDVQGEAEHVLAWGPDPSAQNLFAAHDAQRPATRTCPSSHADGILAEAQAAALASHAVGLQDPSGARKCEDGHGTHVPSRRHSWWPATHADAAVAEAHEDAFGSHGRGEHVRRRTPGPDQNRSSGHGTHRPSERLRRWPASHEPARVVEAQLRAPKPHSETAQSPLASRNREGEHGTQLPSTSCSW